MRRRLTVAIVGIATAAVVLFAVPLALVLRTSYFDEELARLQRDTIAATRTIDVSRSAADPIELPQSSDMIAVYDGAGDLVAGTGPPTAGELAAGVEADGRSAQLVDGGQLRVAVPLLSGENIGGVVEATRNDDSVLDRTHAAWLRLAALATAVIAVAGLAAFVVGRRLARPLEHLARSARRLGEGDFAVRSQPSGVSEVDAVGSALDSTAQRLDDLVSRERSFSADASHQLRTPLSALRLELEGMELQAGVSEELTAALSQVERLQSTIGTLLKAARDEGEQGMRTDLRALLEDAAPRWRRGLTGQGRRLLTLIEASEPVAAASPTVISEILDVLVSNASRHGAGMVAVTVRDAGGGVAVDVADEGNGLSVEPEQVFVRRAGTGEGHGIGLALARSLAHAEGGRLIVTDAGSKPVFTLLLARPDEVPAEV